MAGILSWALGSLPAAGRKELMERPGMIDGEMNEEEQHAQAIRHRVRSQVRLNKSQFGSSALRSPTARNAKQLGAA